MHGGGPRAPRQLTRERGLEAQPAPGAMRRPEEAHATVVRERPLHGAVRQHDQLVDAGGERAQLVDRRPERRARRVDLLRDDDEPHAARASTARSDQLDDVGGVLLGRVRPRRRARLALRAEALGERAVGEEPDERVRDLGGRSGSTSSPDSPSRTTSGIPPARAPTTARPRQSASSTTLGVPSDREASRSNHASSNAFTTSGVSSRLSQVTRPGKLADERLSDVAMSPVSDDPQRGLRDARGGEPPGLCDRMDVLVSLEHADEQGGRALGERRDRRLGERSELGVGRERERRLDPGLADDPGRERRQRPHGVRPADGHQRGTVGQRCNQRAGARPVEP